MASVGPRGRRLHKSQILSTVHVVGHKGEKSNLGETNPFCSRLGEKSILAFLGNFPSWFDHTKTRKTPKKKHVSERQSPQPQPFANVRGRYAVLSVRNTSIHVHVQSVRTSMNKLRPPPKFHKLRPPSQAFKQHTLIEELSSNVNVHNALKLAQRPL